MSECSDIEKALIHKVFTESYLKLHLGNYTNKDIETIRLTLKHLRDKSCNSKCKDNINILLSIQGVKN